jgi:hypothetical protein
VAPLAAAGRRPVGGAAGCALAAARIGSAFTAADARGGAGLGTGLAELAWRQRRPRVQVLLPPLPEPLQVAGQDVDTPRLVVRGPWLLLLWREDRRRRRLLFWPDVLDSGQRRELRLAVAARAVSRRPRSMAP